MIALQEHAPPCTCRKFALQVHAAPSTCWMDIGPVKTSRVCLQTPDKTISLLENWASQDMFGPVKTCWGQSRHVWASQDMLYPVKTCLQTPDKTISLLENWASQDMFGPVKTCLGQSRHVCKHLTRQYLCWKIDVQMYGS